MTKDEAKKAMAKGLKVTHRFFTDNKWVTMRDENTVLFEDGCICYPSSFWTGKMSSEWDDGWSLFSPGALG